MPDLAILNMVSLLLLALPLAMGANARIARIIAEDTITEPWRARLRKDHGTANMLVKWVHCPWCCGWWTAWPVTAAAWFPVAGLRYWWLFPLAVFAVAHAAGRLNHSNSPTPRS